MKPNIDNLNMEKTPKPDFDLDISMLTPEAYRLEKQRKQEELIKKANEIQKPTIEYQTSPSIEKFELFQFGTIEDFLLLFNEFLEDHNITPLSDIEVNQIKEAIDQFKGISLLQMLEGDPQQRSFFKDAKIFYKVWKIIKNIIYPRIKPYVLPYFKENLVPFFKNYFKINLKDLRNDNQQDQLSL